MSEPKEDIENFDDKDSVAVEAELPEDSFNPEAVTDEEVGCE